MSITFTGWFGFWIFLVVFVCIEGALFVRGYDTLVWQHKTPEEKQIQQQAIEGNQ